MSATKTSGEASHVAASETAFIQDNFGKAMGMSKKLLESQLQTSSALLSFAGQRIQAQAEFLGRFSSCHSLDEAAKAQTKYFEAMIADYGRELTQLAEMARASTIMATDAMRETTKAGKAM